MHFPRELLAENERLIFDLRPHWLALIGPVFWTLVTLVAIVWADNVIPDDWEPTGALVLKILIFIAWFVLAVVPFLQWRFTMFVLTSDRLITRRGIIAKHSKEIPLERINDVAFSQRVLERVFGAGDLMIESAGETGQTRITNVRKPEQVQLAIYKESEENSNRMMRGGGPSEAPPDATQQLEALARLRDQGVLSEQEFESKKQDVLRRF
ncbi:MAG: PH domain-containing protein [Actinomycetota bacterium]|nr:PH domain-containing protein [Actinomycetota bacterium]